MFPYPGKNGVYAENPDYKEIHVLDKLLTDAGIPHTMKRCFDGWWIAYPTDHEEEWVADVSEHMFSSGHDKDLLEIVGWLVSEEESYDSVRGWYLTAKEVFQSIQKHYKEAHNGE